jgi:hypothetical protein
LVEGLLLSIFEHHAWTLYLFPADLTDCCGMSLYAKRSESIQASRPQHLTGTRPVSNAGSARCSAQHRLQQAQMHGVLPLSLTSLAGF